MKESTYISTRGYAMRLGKIFVYGCVAYALYSIATCSVCSSTSPEDAKARQKSEQTASNTEDNIETKLGENNKNRDNRNSDDDSNDNSDDDKRKENKDYDKKKDDDEYKTGKETAQPEDKLHQISKGIGDKINYAVDNITDNVSGHIKKKADDATKPYIEPWKELGAEVGRYGRALSNDYNDGKLLRD